MGLVFNVAAAMGSVVFVLWWYIHVPSDMPRNIPTIPIYVSLLGLWSDMGQDEIYERWLRGPLERHGAVKIWFAGRWSVLVSRSEYLTDMFRREDLYAKAGSQVKIPWSVIAALVGGNIINSTGDEWKLMTSIMKPGMQKRNWGTELLIQDTALFVTKLVELQNSAKRGAGVAVNPLIQRWAVQSMGRNFLDLDLGCLDQAGVRIEELQTIIKRTLFKPLFFNFPTLDKYKFIFRSRIRAYNIMQEFGDLLCALAAARPSKQRGKLQDQEKSIETPKSPEEKQVVDLLDEALASGRITMEQYRANIKITFLTAHENAQQLLNSAFWVLGQGAKGLALQEQIRTEVLATNTSEPSAEVLNAMPDLTATIYELLRLYPPVSQLINRVTVEPALLGGTIQIPKRTWVGWNAYGAHVDPANWGPDAMTFDISRWGKTTEAMSAKVRRDCVAGRYIPFNAHSRKCLGQGFALLEMKIVLFELVRRTTWRVDPSYKLKLTSGGILAPLNCRVIFQELESQSQPRSHDLSTSPAEKGELITI